MFGSIYMYTLNFHTAKLWHRGINNYDNDGDNGDGNNYHNNNDQKDLIIHQ
jgi:hypothetical protein